MRAGAAGAASAFELDELDRETRRRHGERRETVLRAVRKPKQGEHARLGSILRNLCAALQPERVTIERERALEVRDRVPHSDADDIRVRARRRRRRTGGLHELDEVPGRILDDDRLATGAAVDRHGSAAGRDDRRAELFQSRERRIDIAHDDHQHHGAGVLNSLARPADRRPVKSRRSRRRPESAPRARSAGEDARPASRTSS